MASELKKEPFAESKEAVIMNTRLENIVVRQKRSRVRDIAFAALVLFAGAVSLSSLATAASAANDTHELAKK